MIKIITDSTADLGEDLVNEFKVKVIPLSVFIGGKTYRDGLDLDPGNLFAMVEKYGELPKTAAPSVLDFQAVFKGAESLYVGISSKLSATLQNAHLAKDEIPGTNVRIVDSLNLSTGIGLLVLKAAELRDAGCSLDEIEQALLSSRSKVRTSFVVETMDYLYKGGRCTALQALMGSMLKIRPIIDVRQDGTIGVKAKARGTRQKALEMMLADFEGDLSSVDLHRIFVTHTGCDQDAAFLAGEITRMSSADEIRITLAGSVISSHCGPGTIGILYFVK